MANTSPLGTDRDWDDPNWGFWSLVAFTLALASPIVGFFLASASSGDEVLFVFINTAFGGLMLFSLAGLAVATLGVQKEWSRRSARKGLILNGIIVGLMLLLITVEVVT